MKRFAAVVPPLFALAILPFAALSQEAKTAAQAPETKPATAVYVAGDAIPDHRKAVLETHLLKAIVNSGADVSGDNAAAFLAAVKEEQNKRQTTALNDGLLCEIGRKTGVKFICAATVTPAQTDVFKLSGRMLSVKTGTSALKGETAGALKTTADIESACATLVKRMLGKTSDAQNKPEPKSGQTAQAAQTAPTPTVSVPPPAVATAAPPSAATAASSAVATVAPPVATTAAPPPAAATASVPPAAQANTGRISITILPVLATGLGEDQSYLPELVRDELIQVFSSSFDVLDRESVEAVWAELTSAAYDDKLEEVQNIGRLTNTSHYMRVTMTKTVNDYLLTLRIVRIADKMTPASYSHTFGFGDLYRRTGIREAALDLLQQMDVPISAEAQKKLVGPAKENYINSRDAYAQGVTAQRQGSEVAALIYYLQAAAFDPSLRDAVDRSSILSANIKSGNIGQDARSDIAWRKQWVERLAETERFFDRLTRTEAMPCTFVYMVDIKQKAINYQRETVDLQTISAYLQGRTIWAHSIERALQEVYDGLNATGRAQEWGLANWPHQRVTNLNPFSKRNDFSIGYELLNENNKVIHHGKIDAYGSWQMNYRGRPGITVTTSPSPPVVAGAGYRYTTYTMNGINANDITNNMTIRIVSVNGMDAEAAAINGVLRIRAVSHREFTEGSHLRYENGVVLGFVEKPVVQSGRYIDLIAIPDTIRGEPVISIGSKAFSNLPTQSIIIGANITMKEDSFDNQFPNYYYHNFGKKAGMYMFDFASKRWSFNSRENLEKQRRDFEKARNAMEKNYNDWKQNPSGKRPPPPPPPPPPPR